jgi:pantoate--beta-alanine ligase
MPAKTSCHSLGAPALVRHGASEKNLEIVRVPGAFEMPLAVRRLAQTRRYDAIVALGAVVRGETSHFDIVAGETLRESDGLAMSSRNRYLSSAERIQAGRLHQELSAMIPALQAGETDYAALCGNASRRLKMAGWRVDYVALRDADTLQSPTSDSRRLVALGAAWLGHTRLIDNLEIALGNRP